MNDNDRMMRLEILGYAQRGLDEFLSKCESPIEVTMALALLRQAGNWPNYIGVATGPADKLFPGSPKMDCHPYVRWSRSTDDAVLSIVPQAKITVGDLSLRMDFALVVKTKDGRIELKMAIECDGHEFHERTKEQATKDKKRDRALQAAGWVVFRFSGSDIFTRSTYCAQECLNLAVGETAKHLPSPDPTVNPVSEATT